MLHIPKVVAQRLEHLAVSEPYIQNPNFNVGDLTYHEPDLMPGVSGAREGSWSDRGEIFEFGLIGQLSAHQTLIGDYGDMFARNPGLVTFGLNEIVRAKWKISLAVPHDDIASGPHQILRRQFESLYAIEMENFAECTANTRGVIKTQGFAFNGDKFWRASALSENIFQQFDTHDSTMEAYERHDCQGIVVRLPVDKKANIGVRPVEYFNDRGERVAQDQLHSVFRPGVWVELSCKLRVWASTEKDKMGQLHRPASRSYQIVYDAVQLLADGRLREGPVKTAPRSTGAKRRFQAATAGTEVGAKKMRFGEVPVV